MKKTLIAGLIGLVLAAPLLAAAADFRVGERYTLAGDEVIAGDMYAAAGTLVLAGDMQGDAAAASGDLTLTGNVAQDALLAGGTLVIEGAVADDLRVVGGDITIAGSVVGDVVVAGGTVRIAPRAIIGGDLLMAGGTLIIDGKVAGDARIAGGQTIVGGSIGGTMRSYSEQLVLLPSAVIKGDLINRSDVKATLETGAVVEGKVIDDPMMVRPRTAREMLFAAGTISFIGLLFAGVLCYWLFKNRSNQFVAHSLAHFWKEVLRGLVLFIALPILVIALIVSIIGMPIGFILLFLYLTAILLAKIFGGILLGGWINRNIFKKPDQVFTLQTIIGGNVILALLGFVPVAGGIISLLFMLLGFGAFWGYGYRHFWKNR